jgi:predicted nucleotidyltransferase
MMLEAILGYKSSWRILSLLLETPRKLISRTEIYKHTRLGNSPLSKGLERLTNANIIIKEKKGKKEYYYINTENPFTKNIQELWTLEKKELRFLEYDIKIILSEIIRSISEFNEIQEIYLFGSYAKGTASINSDVDLGIITNRKFTETPELTNTISNIEKKHKKEIQLHFLIKQDLKTNPVGREIINTGIKIF